LPDRTISAEIVATLLRKAKAAIRDASADNIVSPPQGQTVAGVDAEPGLERTVMLG
jgi:hypothetical protein